LSKIFAPETEIVFEKLSFFLSTIKNLTISLPNLKKSAIIYLLKFLIIYSKGAFYEYLA